MQTQAAVDAQAERSAEAAAELAAQHEAMALAKAQAALPKQPLTPDLLFKFLVAEVAGQRGAIGVAQSTYLDLARQTQDPRVARRAVEVSMFARNQPGALEAARLWAASDADSERARQTLAALLLSEGQMEEVEPILRTLLQSNTANGFLHLSALMGKLRDTQAALALVERLAADHPTLPEAQFAIAQAAAAAGRFDTALAALERADALRPGWEPAALRRAQLIGKTSNADAIHFMRDFLVRHPDARDVRLGYARALVNANQFADARTEFTRLTTDFPQNAEISLAAGLLSFQMGDHAAARDLLTRTLEFSPRDADIVQYYLGQVAEQMKQPEAALAHYDEVQSGNYLVPARARQAALLARVGRSDEARALLAATRGENDAQNVRLIQAQAELLRESKASEAVYEMLSEGLKRYPDSAELLYDRAMAAEKLDKLDVLEADLRRVIVLRPDDAQAYNALGYTLADRTDRLAEAIVLLDKALALAPEDPFILDSVGWAQYRSGNLARAQEYLERAYKVRPDPEIAAHLGEVLWARGQRDEAGKLWQSSLHVHPQNELLLETLRRHAH
ncbi:MAG: tetratricopeptide repeat protein [Thiobacillus sp.]|uniref:tetratricopeptide repeat protein n=1 Tax=Thiobacillus sp. TaxID=924 RepID=UPI0027327625|nr:tetratricopeptide repeat protein [Thiobacillus sp.]MDP3585419.1 tetratricopeptide repeat protein [Thiobacillus sp.]